MARAVLRLCHSLFEVVHGCSAEALRGPFNLEAGPDRRVCRRPFRPCDGAIPDLAHHVHYISCANPRCLDRGVPGRPVNLFFFFFLNFFILRGLAGGWGFGFGYFLGSILPDRLCCVLLSMRIGYAVLMPCSRGDRACGGPWPVGRGRRGSFGCALAARIRAHCRVCLCVLLRGRGVRHPVYRVPWNLFWGRGRC